MDTSQERNVVRWHKFLMLTQQRERSSQARPPQMETEPAEPEVLPDIVNWKGVVSSVVDRCFDWLYSMPNPQVKSYFQELDSEIDEVRTSEGETAHYSGEAAIAGHNRIRIR